MTQSPHPFGTRPSNSSKRFADVYFNLEEIKVGGETFLTELTWSYRMIGQSFDQHFAIRHPGSAEADALIKDLDPSYKPPHRWSAIVVAKAFLTDYEALPKGTAIIGPTIEQCLALEEYLSVLPDVSRDYISHFRVLDQEFGPDMVRGINESLRTIRTNAVRNEA